MNILNISNLSYLGRHYCYATCYLLLFRGFLYTHAMCGYITRGCQTIYHIIYTAICQPVIPCSMKSRVTWNTVYYPMGHTILYSNVLYPTIRRYIAACNTVKYSNIQQFDTSYRILLYINLLCHKLYRSIAIRNTIPYTICYTILYSALLYHVICVIFSISHYIVTCYTILHTMW